MRRFGHIHPTGCLQIVRFSCLLKWRDGRTDGPTVGRTDLQTDGPFLFEWKIKKEIEGVQAAVKKKKKKQFLRKIITRLFTVSFYAISKMYDKIQELRKIRIFSQY